MEVYHVRGRVCGAQDPVGIQETSLHRAAELSGNDSLEDISVSYVFFRFLHNAAVFFSAYIAGEIYLLRFTGYGRHRCAFDQSGNSGDLRCGFPVILHHFISPHIDNDTDFLFQMVIGDHLVKKHHIIIRKCAFFNIEHRFRIADHGICEISHKTAGKRRHTGKPRGLVIFHDFSQYMQRLFCLHCFCLPLLFYIYFAVPAGYPHDRIISQKGISSPSLPALDTLQKIVSFREPCKFAEQRNRCCNIRIDFSAYRYNGIFFCQFQDCVAVWCNCHVFPPFPKSEIRFFCK